jgi:hypothetical protein
VCIPGGNYRMGCVPGDDDCADNEKPLVMPTLTPFFIDEKEATIAEVIEWLNAIKDGEGFEVYPGSLHYMGDYFWGASWNIGVSSEDAVTPVTYDGSQYIFNNAANEECAAQGGVAAAAGGFSWLGAKMYCEHKGVQLPTEAQWEAAARGQNTNIWPCGSDLEDCWYGVYGCCGQTEVYYWAFSECASGCIDPQPEPPETSTTAHLAKGGSITAGSQSEMRVSARTADNIYVDEGTFRSGVRCARPDAPFAMPDAGFGRWEVTAR